MCGQAVLGQGCRGLMRALQSKATTGDSKDGSEDNNCDDNSNDNYMMMNITRTSLCLG